jgi:hypothetical protein
MHRGRISPAKRLLALALLVPFLGLIGISATDATVTTPTIEQTSFVPLDSMYLDMAVGPSTNDVFVTTKDEVMKLSEDGTPLGTVPLDYPLGMVFAGGALWMAVADANEVIAMNPNTMQIIAAYSVPFPEAIAPTEGEIWVESIPVGGASVPTLVKIDPQTGIITDTGVDLPGERLEANPAIPGQLLSWSDGSPEVLELFSVAGPVPTELASYVNDEYGSPPTVSFLPDGSAFIAESNASDNLQTYNSQTLQPEDPVYNIYGVGNAGAEVSTADGGVLVAEINYALSSSIGGQTLLFGLNDPGVPLLSATYTNYAYSTPTDEYGQRLSRFDGVALSNDGTHLYLAVGGTEDSSMDLDIFDLSGSILTSPATTTPDDGFTSLPAAQAPTTTAVSSSINPAPVSTPEIDYTATVTPAPDDGTVAFEDNGVLFLGCTAVPLISGAATCHTNELLASGDWPITANYSGDVSYGASLGCMVEVVPIQPPGTSAAVTQTCPTGTSTSPPSPSPTTSPTPPATASSKPSTSVVTDSSTKHAVRLSTTTPRVVLQHRAFTLDLRFAGAVGVPKGRALVTIGKHRVCSVRLSKSGSARCRVGGMRPGLYSLDVSFSGSPRYSSFEKLEKLHVRR